MYDIQFNINLGNHFILNRFINHCLHSSIYMWRLVLKGTFHIAIPSV